MFIQQDRIDDTGPVSARQQPNSTFPVMAIDRFLESWASSFNHRQVAVEDEMQPLQQVEIDRRRHRNDETVVGEMTMTEWQYETFAGMLSGTSARAEPQIVTSALPTHMRRMGT